MKKTNKFLLTFLTLTLIFSSFGIFGQATMSMDKSGLVKITAISGEEASQLINDYTNKIINYQEKSMNEESEEISKEELANILSGVGAFSDGENSLLGKAKKIYLNTIFPQFKEVETQSQKSKGEVDYDVNLTKSEERTLSFPLGLGYLMKPVRDSRTERFAILFDIEGKLGLVVDDGKGNFATKELREGENPQDESVKIELRGGGDDKSSCYKFGFKSKFKGSYWTKWMWHSTGFAGYDYSVWGFTIQGYATYAKVTSWKRGGWLNLFIKKYYTQLSVNLKGNVYNHRCGNSKYINKSNSKNYHYFCGTGAVGLWRSRIKNNSLSSHAYAKNIASTDLSIK